MSYLTYRYRIEGSTQMYASLRSARWHCKDYRNACLQERITSYKAARDVALRNDRNRPNAADWIIARGPHLPAFMAWQDDHRSDLIRRHDQAQQRKVNKSWDAFEKGKLLGPLDLRFVPWREKGASDFGRSISLQDQVRDLAEIRASDPNGIGAVPVSVLREHAVIVDEAMKAFFRRVKAGETPGFPRFKGFDQVTTLECPFGDGISFERFTEEDGRITSCRLKSMMWQGGLKVRMHRPLPSKPKRVSLSYDGRFWWASFLVEIPDGHVPHALPRTVLGADVGVNRLVTLDDGSWYENPRFLLAGALAIKAASRKLSAAKRGSTARRKAKRALAAAHRKVRNRRNTWRHTVAKDLARKAETIVFEALKPKNMMRSASGTMENPGTRVAQKRGLNRVLSDASFAAIVKTTRHKAESAGGRVLLVDPRNSSLECSRCHAIVVKEVYDLHDCPHCGLRLHRDHNAGIVLRDRGIAILGGDYAPRRGARSTGPWEAAGRHRSSGPEKAGKQRRDDVASRAAFGQSA